MRIWWCQEHDVSGDEERCLAEKWNPCRMGPMRLIPDNAETVERIAKAIVFSEDWETDADAERGLARAILAALDGGNE